MTALSSRQDEIVITAIRLIAVGGIQKMTIKNLAARIGITEPAIYRHFKSKMEILIAILDRFDRNGQAHYEDPTVQEGGLTGILTFLRKRFMDFNEKPFFAAVIFAEEHFRNHHRLTRRVQQIMDSHCELFTALIRKAQKAGSIRADIPAPSLFLTIFGAFRLLVKQWHLSVHAFDIVKEGNRLLDSMQILLSH